jgi:hypothetical protein
MSTATGHCLDPLLVQELDTSIHAWIDESAVVTRVEVAHYFDLVVSLFCVKNDSFVSPIYDNNSVRGG